MFRRTVMLTVTSLFLVTGLSIWCLEKIEERNNAHVTSTVKEETKFHKAEMNMTEKEFEKAGFELGDSVDVEFSNGHTILDVPYLSGYYVKNGEPVVVAYPGVDNIYITYSNIGIWNRASLEENDEVTIRLNEKHKYDSVQDTLGKGYSSDRGCYSSDEEFSNFRCVNVSCIKEGLIYRGASPVDDSRGRAAITDKLLEKNGIKYVINLADLSEDLEKYMSDKDFDSPYYAELYKNNNVSFLNMDSSYTSTSYHHKVVAGLRDMMKYSGPFYIHCQEGKDRTGFVCCLLEALAGASYDEMKTDYMHSYEYYYGLSAEKTPEKYNAISNLYFESFVSYLHDTDDHRVLELADYKDDAVRYLINGGMTMDEISALQKMITK